MFCIACGTELPEDANFCLKCGRPCNATAETVSASTDAKRWTHNENPPYKIKRLWFGFFGPQVGLGKRGFIVSRKTIKRHFYVDFQLADERGIPTTCSGTVHLSIDIFQNFEYSSDGVKLGQVRGSKRVEMDEWRLEQKSGEPYWRYESPSPLEVLVEQARDPEAKIEIRFAPDNPMANDSLFALREISADVQLGY